MMTNPPVLTTHDLSIGYGKRSRGKVKHSPSSAPSSPSVLASSLDLCLHAGELVCLLGPNGVGKSTLLRTLAGMHPPLEGQALLGGQDITTLHPRDLATRLSVVLTERVEVGNLSAYALVALGRHPYTNWMGTLTPRDEAVVRQAMEAVGAAHLAHRQMPELSDGERQRVMIARALAQEPLLMILDEPTAFLDVPSRVEVMRLLRSLAHTTGRAVLLSTHDLDLALRSADLLWLMAPGGAVSTGAPEDLVLSGAVGATFQRDGVTFDPETGTFQVRSQTRGQVALRGEGVATTWTARALERAGFEVLTGTASKDAPISVAVLAHTEGMQGGRWQSTGQGGTCTHTSLYDLLAFLRQHEPE
jgi:iron complex transport system ATP-binding protein